MAVTSLKLVLNLSDVYYNEVNSLSNSETRESLLLGSFGWILVRRGVFEGIEDRVGVLGWYSSKFELRIVLG